MLVKTTFLKTSFSNLLSKCETKRWFFASPAVTGFFLHIFHFFMTDPLLQTFVAKKSSEAPAYVPEAQYWHLYPKDVKQWITDARKPPGYYNENGVWVEDELGAEEPTPLTEEEEKAIAEG